MQKGSGEKGQQPGDQEHYESEQIGEQESSRRWPSTQWGNSRAQVEPESAKSQQHCQEHAERENTQAAAPAIDGRNPLDLSRRRGGTKKEDLATNATDLVPDLADEGIDLSPSPECITTTKPEQKAQAIDLEAIGDVLGVLAREQTVEVFEEDSPARW